MHYDSIVILNSQKSQRINTSLLALLAIATIAYFAHTTDTQIIKYVAILMATAFSVYLVLSTRKEGFAAGFCVLLGCAAIVLGMLVSNDLLVAEKSPIKSHVVYHVLTDQKHQMQISKEFLHLHSLFIGILCISLGLIFAYRPSLIRVKNYLPFEYPYPIWNSQTHPVTGFATNLIPTKDLLTSKERMVLCRIKYLVVSINGTAYLVSPNEMIPADSVIMRTKSGNLMCGISKF